MKKTSLRILLLTLVVLAIVSLVRFIPDRAVSKEFDHLIANSNQEQLDLTQLNSIDWDEFAVWLPYTDICDYQLDGFEKNGKNCHALNEDTESYALFIKDNKLVGKVKIDRKKIDFATSEIKGRVPKEKAKFIYLSKGDWPKVSLSP